MSQEYEIARAFLKALKDKFNAKIDPSEYALSYSGGRDSHLLFWFIKEFLEDDKIKIVSVNTGFELPEIRERIMRNADVVLRPAMKRKELKERYGIPCFSKKQDDYIYRYQHGSRSANTMDFVSGANPVFNLNRRARTLLLDGRLHPISHKCCLKTKEEPLMRWQKENGRKAIIGVRQSESLGRKAVYNTCMKQNGDFTPIHDWPDDLVDLVYREYQIEVPRCYMYLTRTGCAGCPYGRNIETELSLLPDQQRRAAVSFFRESYDVKGVNYTHIQGTLFY